jgi:DNA-binding NarL/FixJ family response regulator
MAIRVGIYEDNTELNDALALLVANTAGLLLAGTYTDCLNVTQDTFRDRPDVVLMDINLPLRDGIQAVQALHRDYPEVDVLMLTIYDDDDRVFRALCAGAKGYLLKHIEPEQIVTAIRDVYDGGSPMSPSIARRVLQSFVGKSVAAEELSSLTSRENQILHYLAQGMSNKLVANELTISVETVRTHIKRIYEKLQVHSVTEAIAKYRQ